MRMTDLPAPVSPSWFSSTYRIQPSSQPLPIVARTVAGRTICTELTRYPVLDRLAAGQIQRSGEEMSMVGELLGRYPIAVRRARSEHEQSEDGNGNQQFDQRKAWLALGSGSAPASSRPAIARPFPTAGGAGCPPPLMRKSLGRAVQGRLRRIA